MKLCNMCKQITIKFFIWKISKIQKIKHETQIVLNNEQLLFSDRNFYSKSKLQSMTVSIFKMSSRHLQNIYKTANL